MGGGKYFVSVFYLFVCCSCLGFFLKACAEHSCACIFDMHASFPAGRSAMDLSDRRRSSCFSAVSSALAPQDDGRRRCESACCGRCFSGIVSLDSGFFHLLFSGTIRVRFQYFSEYIKSGGLKTGLSYEGPERERAELPFLPYFFLGAVLACWWGGAR